MKTCKKTYKAAWYQANKEKIAAQRAAYYLDNKDRIAAYQVVYNAANKDKVAARQSAYNAINKDRWTQYHIAYYAANRDVILARAAIYQQLNIVRVLTYGASYRADHIQNAVTYRATNRANYRIYDQNRRARKLQSGGRLSIGLAAKLFKQQHGICGCGCEQPLCGSPHLDHWMPLFLGGSNTDDNIKLLRAKCNLQKGRKHPDEFIPLRDDLF